MGFRGSRDVAAGQQQGDQLAGLDHMSRCSEPPFPPDRTAEAQRQYGGHR